MSMPNWVPQSPMWCRRTTVSPVNSSICDQRVTDHRGPQVTDVHLLGHVRLRVVDDRGARVLGERHTEPVGVRGPRGEVPVIARVGEGDVQEAGARRPRCPRSARRPAARATTCGGQLARVAPCASWQRQDPVGLEVGPVASSQQRVGGGGLRQGGRQGVREVLLDENR